MRKKQISLQNLFPYILVIGGLIGMFASITLSYDTLQISKNSHYVPYCNLNPLLNCGTVINTAGDTIFGVPYPYYGIAAFAILFTVGTALLAGAKFKKWYWRALQAGITLGVIGAYGLFFKSVFKIHALCPYCLSVDVTLTTVFWYLTLYNIDNKHLLISKHLAGGKAHKMYTWVRKHHLDLLVLWFLLMIAFILHHFWYYYKNHL